MQTFLIIYFSGFVAAYIGWRLMDRFFDKKTTWTVGDRTRALAYSLLSWILVLLIVVILAVEFVKKISSVLTNNGDDQRPAKW